MRYQYRMATDSFFTSDYGRAFWLLMNGAASGRKLTIRSLEVFNNSIQAAVSIPARLVLCASMIDGENMSAMGAVLDSSGLTLPFIGVTVKRSAVPNAVTSVLGRANLMRQTGAVGTQNLVLFGKPQIIGSDRRGGFGGQLRSPMARGGTAWTEPIAINQNEAIALQIDQTTFSGCNHVRVNLVLNIGGHVCTYNFTDLAQPGMALFSVENTSGTKVLLLRYGITDVGTTDTPTLRIVPVGSMFSDDIADPMRILASTNVMKMNSADPSLPAAVKFYSDVPLRPAGMPEVAIAPASAGTPQGMNYLHTRDFWGPMFRNLLAESCHMKIGGIPDALGTSYSHKRCDLLARHRTASLVEGITVNPGEGIAIVNSAETAVGVQPAFGGWPGLSFAAQLDSDPQFSPILTFTGLVDGTEVRVMSAGTQTELAGVESTSGGTFTWSYDPDVVTSVDVNIIHEDKQVIRYEGLALGLSGATIPVQQQVDRNYQP